MTHRGEVVRYFKVEGYVTYHPTHTIDATSWRIIEEDIMEETNYPGKGLTAEVQAFNAYKLWRERERALSDSETWLKYNKLVIEYDAEQRRLARVSSGRFDASKPNPCRCGTRCVHD